jgi:hypothetical protein
MFGFTLVQTQIVSPFKYIIVNKYYLNFWRKLNEIIFCQKFLIAFLQHVLTYGVKGGAYIFFIIINFLGVDW